MINLTFHKGLFHNQIFPLNSTLVLNTTGSRCSNKLPNLGGSLLKIAVMNYLPFFISESYYQKPVEDGYDGIEVQIVKEMAKQLNFTYEYLMYESWGIVLANGSWKNDVGRAMQDGIADLAMANLWQIPSLYSVVDYGPSLTKARLVFLVWRPEIMEFEFQTVMKIFKPIVWYATLASSILVTILYWGGIKLVHPSTRNSFAASVLTIFGFFTMATSYATVDKGNVRVTLTGWAVFCLLLTTFLSSGIISCLTLPKFTPRIDSFQQLVEGKFYWVTQYYVDFLNNTEIRSSMFDLNNTWMSLFEATYTYMDEEQVRKKTGSDKKMVFPGQTYGENLVILDTDGLYEHESLQNYRVSEQDASGKYISFGVKKNSPLLEPLTILALRFIESGLIEYWRDRVLERWPEFDTSELLVEMDFPTFGEPEPLELHKLLPVFNFLLIGLFVSTCVFVMEIMW